MHISRPGVSLHPTQAPKTKATASTSTKPFLGKSPISPSAKTKASLGSLPISQAELNSLAADLKNGLIDKEEANNRFVMTVINNSIGNKLGEEDREHLIHKVRELLAGDDDFVQKLANNLGNLV